jgi:hypothetical protein
MANNVLGTKPQDEHGHPQGIIHYPAINSVARNVLERGQCVVCGDIAARKTWNRLAKNILKAQVDVFEAVFQWVPGRLFEQVEVLKVASIKVVGHVQPLACLALDVAVWVGHRDEGQVRAVVGADAGEDAVQRPTTGAVPVKTATQVLGIGNFRTVVERVQLLVARYAVFLRLEFVVLPNVDTGVGTCVLEHVAHVLGSFACVYHVEEVLHEVVFVKQVDGVNFVRSRVVRERHHAGDVQRIGSSIRGGRHVAAVSDEIEDALALDVDTLQVASGTWKQCARVDEGRIGRRELDVLFDRVDPAVLSSGREGQGRV